MIKVLQVIGSLNYGGIESVIMNYYRHIDRNEVQFDFITTSGGGRFEDEIRELGGNIFCLPSKSRQPFGYMKQLKKIIKENKYDIVHSNTNSASAFLDLYPAKKAGCKVRIAHSHNTNCLVKWQHRIFKPLLPTVTTHRFACYDAAAKWLFGGNKNYTIINNGIDFDKFAFNSQKRNEVRTRLNWNDDFVIGNVASFQERKNQKFLVEILPELAQQVPNVKLVLVGLGSTQESLKQLSIELNVSDKIEFLGARNDVDELLQAFDVFCFPSLYEGLAVAYIEAAVSGLPVIISDGVPYVSVTDALYRLPLDKKQWIDKIVQICKADTPRRIFTESEKTYTGFNIHDLAKSLQNYYYDMVKSHTTTDKEEER